MEDGGDTGTISPPGYRRLLHSTADAPHGPFPRPPRGAVIRGRRHGRSVHQNVDREKASCTEQPRWLSPWERDKGAPSLRLATPDVAALQPATALDTLEATTQEIGTTILRRLLCAQWEESDAVLVALSAQKGWVASVPGAG